jgi:hypothetical protein
MVLAAMATGMLPLRLSLQASKHATHTSIKELSQDPENTVSRPCER